jgi:hypothetical protein
MRWLGRKVRPDVVVMFYNDHGLNFFLDKMPTFAVGAAPQYHNADEGWGIPTLPAVQGRPGPVVAHHQHAGRQGVRRGDLPGNAGRPCVHAAAEAVLARRATAR